MRNRPTKFPNISLYFLVLILLLGCSKDSDLLNDALFNGESQSVEDRAKTETSTEVTEPESQETEVPSIEPETENIEDPTAGINSELESRQSTFTTLHDAHLQSGKGYNQNIIRLEEGHRTSYLMFDLSPIDSIGATITEAKLQITINSDDGDGTVNVSKGVSNDWTENNLSASTPGIEVELGSLTKQYKVGATEEINLDVVSLQATKSTLILEHKDGNDLAFASKEHPSNIGPKLVVAYEVAVGAPSIEIPEIVVEEENPSTEENVPTETENNTEEPQSETNTDGNESPMAVADATPSAGGAPLNVQFKGSNSTDDNSVKSFLWDFKDGSSATTANPSHTFDQTGTYEVILTVTDEQGLTDTDIVTITVNEEGNEAPKAVATATPSSGVAPLEVQFKGSNSTDDNSVSSYAWNFKDGSTANNANPSHTFNDPGTYQVLLTVKDENGLADTKTVTITVNEPENEAPKAVATATPSSGVAPLEVQFKGSNSTDDKEVKSYAWNFKDGSTASNANPSHTFANAGNYAVQLTVKDAEGLSHTKTVTINVSAPAQNEAPTAVATANPTSGQAPLNVQFVGSNSTDDNSVTSYSWNFKDGSSANSANPSHTFTSAGSYPVTLTVKDAAGLSNTKTVNITVNEQNNPPPNGEVDYYVTTSGKASNNGKTQSTAWSLEHAFYNAQPGDVIYVKAGNYGNKQLLSRNPGTGANPIKFIGYKNTPGDVNSSNGSTFTYGQSVSAGNMPLLQSSNGQGVALTLYDRYWHLENFQVTGYNIGVQTIDAATNATLKNVIVTKVGNQSNVNSYSGFGFDIKGNNTLIENCIVHNAGAEAISLFNSDNSKIRYTKVYADNGGNPTDYYFMLTGGTNNTVVENCYAERKESLSHGGHGFVMKDLAEHNTFKNCTVKNTNIELNFVGVKNNTVDNCKLYGGGTSSSNWETRLIVNNGANNNVFKNCLIQDTWHAIVWNDYDDGYVGPGGDRDIVSMGYDNTYTNITVKNVETVLNVGVAQNLSAKASRNKFVNSNFSNFDAVARTYNKTENIVFQGCSFSNGDNFVYEADGIYAPHSKFNVSWQNCSWTNVGFNPPN